VAFRPQRARPRQLAPALGTHQPTLCASHLPSQQVRYLGLHAFRRVFRRKQALYGGTLQALDEALAAPRCARCAPLCAAAVDPSHSRVFEAIMY
jgi:hypothetical protein